MPITTPRCSSVTLSKAVVRATFSFDFDVNTNVMLNKRCVRIQRKPELHAEVNIELQKATNHRYWNKSLSLEKSTFATLFAKTIHGIANKPIHTWKSTRTNRKDTGWHNTRTEKIQHNIIYTTKNNNKKNKQTIITTTTTKTRKICCSFASEIVLRPLADVFLELSGSWP